MHIFVASRPNSLTLYPGSILKGPRALLFHHHLLLLILSCLFLFFFVLDVCSLYIYIYISLLSFGLSMFLSCLPYFAHFVTKMRRILFKNI